MVDGLNCQAHLAADGMHDRTAAKWLTTSPPLRDEGGSLAFTYRVKAIMGPVVPEE